jgi:hypothetical protein
MRDEQSMPSGQDRRQEAIRQFALRKDYSEQLMRIAAESSHPDAAKAVHCQYCNMPTEIVTSQPIFPVTKVCSQCSRLEEMGWLEQAINFHEGM